MITLACCMTQVQEKYTKRKLRTSSASTIISISLVLFMLGILGLVLINAQRLSNYVKENIGFTVMLNEDVKEVDVLQLSNTPTLLPNLTLIENTIYFTSSLKVDEKIINTIIEKYNLGSYKNDELKNFSSGMIKRAELAVADMKEPDVLCIDEPLNYLDKQGVEHLQTLINERTDNNKSNVLSSQETSGLLKNKETVNLDEI